MSGSTGLDQTIDYTAKVALPAGSAGGSLESVNVGIGGKQHYGQGGTLLLYFMEPV